jgi:hypothetical protein
MERRTCTHTQSATFLSSLAAMRPRSMNSRSVKHTFTHSVRFTLSATGYLEENAGAEAPAKALGAVATEGEAVMPEASAEETVCRRLPTRPSDEHRMLDGAQTVGWWLARLKAGTAVRLDREEAK